MPIGTITYGDLLERLVNRVVAESEVTKTIFRANLYQARLDKKAKTLTGAWVEYPIYTDESGTAKMFSVYGASDSATYNPYEKVQMVQMDWKCAADFLRLSKIKMQQASGPEELVDYVRTQMEGILESLRQLVSRQLFTGNGLGDNAYGLDTLLSTFSGTGVRSFGGVSILDARSEVARVLDARDINTYNGTTNGSAVFTNGSNLVGEGGATPVDWDSLNIYEGGQLTGPDGVTYTVAGKTANTLHLTGRYLGATTTSSNWSYKGRFSDTATYGSTAGQFHINKVDKAIAIATDGENHPTDIICNNETFTRFLHEIQQKQRFVGTKNEEIGSQQFLTLYVDGAEAYIDNHAPSGTIYFINNKFCALRKLRGYSDPALDRDSLRWDVTGTRIQSLVGEVVTVFVHYIRSKHRCSVIRNLTV